MSPAVGVTAIASALFLSTPEAIDSNPVPSTPDPLHANLQSPIFHEDFEKVQVGVEPEVLFILDGDFDKVRLDGNSVLRLRGEPLAEFGALFGPSRKEDISVSLRVWSESAGRRHPVFGVGLNGITGVRFLVNPATRTVKLAHDETTLKSAPLEWQSGSWMSIILQIAEVSGNLWEIRGKVWKSNQIEPSRWNTIATTDKEPRKGKASLWGIPYSGKDILFDDLRVFETESGVLE